MLAELKTVNAVMTVPPIIESAKRLVIMTKTALMHVAKRIVSAKMAVIPNLKNASKLVLTFEAENRMLSKEEAYVQLGLSTSLLKGILEWVR